MRVHIAVLASKAFASARGNGLQVEVGDILTGLDPKQPPRVERIHRTRVTVSHRGRRYVLDLLGKARVVVGRVAASGAEDR